VSVPWPAAGDDDGEEREAGPAAGRLPEPARRALVSLLMNRHSSAARHRAAWEGVVAFEDELRARLDEMYLDLVVDHEGGTAFKRQQEGDDVPRMLRRDRPLSRDASFTLIFLRREYAFADPDDGPVVVTREQVGEFLRAFREDGDGDDARFARRVDAAINALVRPWQILEPDPAADYLFTVSPVIVPLLGPDELRRFEEAFRQAADGSAPAPPPGTGDSGRDGDDVNDGEDTGS
jgi:Domain of unknown function (DUF4194)